MIIAIDGPAGSGKSTVAKLVAERLGFHYLDTGAMYRAVAFRALVDGVSLHNEDHVAQIAFTEHIRFSHEDGNAIPNRVNIGGSDVTAAIRTPSVDEAVSAVATMPKVRKAMVEQQRGIAATDDIVVEGRDIGTVVFPSADVKVFLTASPDERARRRAAQHALSGHAVDTNSVRDAIMKRDETDSSREHSPLVAAEDAINLDTTGLTIDQVVDLIVEMVREKLS